jgi:DNA-binding NtrC family response regulator
MEPKATILIVDDELAVRDSLGKWFAEEGYRVETAASSRDALRRLPSQRWDLALVDIEMPGMNGLELQRKLHELDPEIIVIIMTGHASVETAVQALKDGAYDYLTKPFDPDDLASVVRQALARHRVRRENARLREGLEQVQAVELVGQNQGMQKVLELVRTVAPTDTTVLIRGESGTGKESVARAIHALSPRRFMPIVILHCGTLTETLLESELFGHEKGAFAGAQYRKKGKFEVAEGGTVFLDEITDISLKPW